jgi:hypothetical protein
MPKKSSKEYTKIKDSYLKYLKNYRNLNRGSIAGSTPFHIFYLYKTYVIRYMEPNRIMAHNYK